MTVTRTSDESSGWLWPAIGLLVLVVIVVAAALLWLRHRRQAAEPGEPSLASDDAVDSARAAVARNPGDLAAHLALLGLLADRGREQEFTDAFDQMYQEVDDESASQWQEALSLAAVHVPDHPLLTPRETSLEGDDDFDRRADEMLGMLEVDETEDWRDTGEEEAESKEDDVFDLGLEDEESEDRADERPQKPEEADEEESFEEDMDLAVLSERLDDPSREPGRDSSLEDDEDDADFNEFKEIDEYSTEDETEDETEEPSEEPSEFSIDLPDEDAPELDLDLDPSREQEADEVFGEAGARETEDLDLDLSSEVDDLDTAGSSEGLEFDLGETAESEPESESESRPGAGEQEEDTEPLDESDTAGLSEAGEDEAQAGAGGSLGDEDADVKLDLARAYISVDLADSARTVLEEVVSDGSEEKRAEAQKLLDEIE